MTRKIQYLILGLLVVVVGVLVAIFAPGKHPAMTTDTVIAMEQEADPLLQRDIQQKIRSQHFKGVALVVKNKQVVYRDAFGYANASKLQENSADIAYPIASLQKFMTGTLIAQLVSEGKLSYDTNVHDFYPEIGEDENIRVRSLLDHSSGIRMGEDDPGVLLGTEEQQLAYVLKTMIVTSDHSFSYTNANYTLLSGIVAQVTGEDYEAVLTDRIINPLGLKQTYTWLNRPHKMVFPRGYANVDGKDYQDDGFTANKRLFSSLLGAGNLFMSVDDMLKVQNGLTNGVLLTPKEYQGLSELENAGYAGGIWHDNGLKSIHGSLGGYDTFVYGDENNQNLVILFGNQPAIDGNGALAEDIYNLIKT